MILKASATSDDEQQRLTRKYRGNQKLCRQCYMVYGRHKLSLVDTGLQSRCDPPLFK
jgi:hypothetical protein